MNEIEEIFVQTFISRDKRERWLTLLPNQKKRGTLLHRLAHSFVDDLDSRFVFDKDNPPPDVAAKVRETRALWAKNDPKQNCHIICNNDDWDGTVRNLAGAEADYDLTYGAILILIPNKLAYYHTERSNLSKQPYYVLFHPQNTATDQSAE